MGWRATKAASTCASVWPLARACAAMRSRRDGDSTVPGQTAPQTVGTLTLANFINPAGLEPLSAAGLLVALEQLLFFNGCQQRVAQRQRQRRQQRGRRGA